MPSKDERLCSRTCWNCRCAGSSVYWRRLNCRSSTLLATMALVVVTAFAPGAARAQNATWRDPAATADFNTRTNWVPDVAVPTGTASFGPSNTTALTFSANTTIGGWTFIAGAPAYTFTNNQAVTFNGAGINGSPAITNTITGFLNFNSGTAGSAIITDNGNLIFNLNSTAGNASITNNFTLDFNNSSTAGSATITNNNTVFFNNRSTAGNATINNNHFMHFVDNSTGGNAAITNTNGALTDFSFSTGPAGNDKVTAGSIAGGGVFQLGANELTVGGNGLSTDVTGIILGNPLSSLVKVGAGTLTLSGHANLGGAVIDGGTLAVNGGNLNASDTIVVGSTAGSSGTLNIGAGGSASTGNLIVGQSGVGTLAVQNGGRVTDSGGFVGDLGGSHGAVTV